MLFTTLATICVALLWRVNAVLAVDFAVPSSPPTQANPVDPSLVSVSIEFFTLPGYTQIEATTNCLANLAELRGVPPAVRIGGTTQDRATYDPTLTSAVNYTVASPADAPASLTYGPPFFTLAGQLQGDVTLGLNRQLNNQAASLAAAVQAKKSMSNLFAFELGNEPEFYASNSPIIPKGQTWNQDTDAVGNMFQGAVYLSWSAGGLLSRIGTDGARFLKSISRHSYPQSACGGASTNLPSLMSHSGIVSYTRQYKAEAAATHTAGLRYFLGETNSATCGGGGISPTFGAALWIVDYVLQAALNGVDRLYFHQGTISNCVGLAFYLHLKRRSDLLVRHGNQAYCFWGSSSVFAPYYGAAFVSDFLGKDNNAKLVMLDNGTSSLAAYALYSSTTNAPLRLLVINSNYFDGTSATTPRSTATLRFTGLPASTTTQPKAKRMTAPSAVATSNVTIARSPAFNSSSCATNGVPPAILEQLQRAADGSLSVNILASEAVILLL
ncbi:hypothetical protein EIP91_000594 [Steccherinum ochraceum]|uniref:Beta-glucuronidase C-terminal domain-containing protein n=1 Tax=Steccherinum ochraceum TaxID=92696 RepID=A0A4R0RFT0_9APHY|nr:hypothetical protein EIP91_000594 [Steccherinum ochraceum]